MRKLTRAFVLGFAASALTLTGCASTGSTAADCDMSAGACTDDCDMSSGSCDMAGKDKASCSTEGMASVGAVNDICPFSGKPVNADIQTISFQGQEIGFCCAGCVSKFTNMTDTERAALLGN